MWENLSLPWQTCLELAWEAYCDDCYPIGAVVTGPAGEILSRGRNRVYPKRLWKKPMRGVDLAHAEMEALFQLDYCDIDPHACSLYTSLEPCPMCMSTFYMSGLRTLQYAASEPFAGNVELLGKSWYMDIKKITVQGPLPELEMPILALVMEPYYAYYSGRLPEDSNHFFEKYFQEAPTAMQLAENLYRRNILEDLRSQKASAEAVFSLLTEEMLQFSQE